MYKRSNGRMSRVARRLGWGGAAAKSGVGSRGGRGRNFRWRSDAPCSAEAGSGAVSSGEAAGGRPSPQPRRRRWSTKRRWDRLVDVVVSAAPQRIVAASAKVLFWPTLWFNQWRHGHQLQGSTRWYDEITEGVLLGALPDDKMARDLVKTEHVTSVVNMVAEWQGPTETYDELGIEQLWLPVVDFTVPSSDDLERAVAFIRDRTQHGKRVYVHCKAGKGRSASVVLAYLVAVNGMSPQQAQELLLSRRPQVLSSLTKRQEIMEFCRRHGAVDGDASSTCDGVDDDDSESGGSSR